MRIVSLTVTDRESGVRVRMRGERVSLTTDAAATPKCVARLWADARSIFGLAYRQAGRPPGTTVTEDELRRVIGEMKRAGRKVGLDTIAAASGTFTRDNLRSYLQVNGRRLRDYVSARRSRE